MTEEVRVVLRVDHRIDNPERDCLAVLGSAHELGCWKHEKAVKAEYMGRSTWQAVVKLPTNQTCVWKWVVLNRATDEILQWESGVDKILEINERPLMGVSEWGKPVVMTDISTESSTRIFEGVKDISCENIHENNRPLETPRPRKKAVEKRGRITGKKVKRVNSKGKLIDDSAVKVRPKQPQKSSNTVAKLASINDLTAFANTCQSNPVKTTLSNSNFLNEESTVKLKGGKGLKGLFQSLLRTQSQKRRSQRTCSGMNGPVKADPGEAGIITTKRTEATEDIPECNAAAASASGSDTGACDEGDTAEKRLLSYKELSSQENSDAAGNKKVSATETQYEDRQIENLGPNGEYKDTICAKSAILTPELTDDTTGFSDCDMILPTNAKMPTVTQSDIDVPKTDIDTVLLSQTKQTVESESKFKTKTNANIAEIEIAAPVITTVNTKFFSCKNGTSHVKANIMAYEEMETKRAKKVRRLRLPSSVHQRSNLKEKPTDDIHAYAASNHLNSSPENTTTLIDMYMFKDYGMRSSVSDQSLHIEKKEADRINSKDKIAVAQDAPMFSQSVESVVNDKTYAVQDKDLGLKTNNMTTCLNVNLEESKTISNTVRALGNEKPNQLTFESLENSENRESGIHLQTNTYADAFNLDTNRKVHSHDAVCKIGRDSKARNNIAEKKMYQSGLEKTSFIDKFITPMIDTDNDKCTKREKQPSPNLFLPWSDSETKEDHKMFKQQGDITAEGKLSWLNKHSLHKASATVCDYERNLIESADTCAYYEGNSSSNSEQDDKQKIFKGILRSNSSYKAPACENECTEPEYYAHSLNFQERQIFSANCFAEKYSDDATNILDRTLNEGSNYHTYKRNTTLDTEPLFAQVNRSDKDDVNRHLKSHHDNNSKEVTCKCLDDDRNGLTMKQCKDLKVVTRHLQEFSKDKEMDDTLNFFSQTYSSRELSNNKNFTGRKRSVAKHTIDNHTHDSGTFVNDDVDALFPHQLFDDKGTDGADINSLTEDETATYKVSESSETDNVIRLNQEHVSANSDQQSYRISSDDTIPFHQQQFNGEEECNTDIISQYEDESTVFKESDTLTLDKPRPIQQDRDLYDAEEHSFRYRNDVTDALQQSYFNENERHDAAVIKSPTENKITVLKSHERLNPDSGVLIQQERGFNCAKQLYCGNGDDVKDLFYQNCFIEKEGNDLATKLPIERETTIFNARKRVTSDSNTPLDQEHLSPTEEDHSYRFQTSPTSVPCPDKGGVTIPDGRPGSENETLKESELSDMAHYPIESISDFANGEVSRSTDESAWENETLEECEIPDMVSYPIESVSDFVCMHKLADVFEKEGITTSKSSTTWEYAKSSDFYWNNLSEYADTNTKTLNNSYEKNIDIVEDDSNPAGDLLDEDVMPERNIRGNEETPRVNFSRDIRRNDFQHVTKVQSVSCMTDETGMVDGKDKLLDLVEKYKVPIGMSVAAACAAIFIMKKN